jgi:phage/plasmid-associated DNA primase
MNDSVILYGEFVGKVILSRLINYYKKYMGLVLCKSEIKVTGKMYEISRYNCSNNKQRSISENLNMVYPCTLKSDIYKKPLNIQIPKESENIELVLIKNQKYYNTKREAISNMVYNVGKYLFSEDLGMNGSKRFYLLTYEKLWKVIRGGGCNYYENYEENDPLKLFVDVDYVDGEISYDELLDKIMDVIDKELLGYEINGSKKIILSSNRTDKKSAHIIYLEVIFGNIVEMKKFMCGIESDLITQKILDPSVYRVGCFRLYLNSKRSKGVELTYYKGINYDYVDEETTYYDTLLKNVKSENYIYAKTKQKSIEKEVSIEKKVLGVEEKDNEVCEGVDLTYTMEEINELLNILNETRYNVYGEWLNVGMCLYNINKGYMMLWDTWSKKGKDYKSGECEKKWGTFRKDKKGMNLLALLSWAKKDNPIEYKKLMQEKKRNSMILKKYPKENIIMGTSKKVNENMTYTSILNKRCFIKGDCHKDMENSMYIETTGNYMTIKCRHEECFGKTYYADKVLSLTKNEMNIFYGNVTININKGIDENVEFEKVELYEDEKLNELVYNSYNGKSSQLAEIIYYKHEDKYMYGENEEWYIYDNHKWKNVGKKNNELRYSIQSTLRDIYREVYHYYKNDEERVKIINNIMRSFGDTTMKNNIITELIDIYTVKKNPRKDFCKNLDKNFNILGFDNGVYDLKEGKFRDGEKGDYITMTVGYDYKRTYSDKKGELMKFLEDILPNEEERNYLLTYLSIGLIGNKLELFTVLTNKTGRNGKSKLIELLKYTLGDYFASIKSQMFTRPCPDANSPDPGLLNLLNKRVVVASEPPKGEKLNVGFIKFLTGRDSATLRNCHSNDMIEFTANFITLLICNDIPECDEIDAAFSKRLRCICFPTEFVETPKNDSQRKMNVNINDNFNYWKQDFMLLLLEYYENYTKTHELKVTKEILKWTDEYKEITDIYLRKSYIVSLKYGLK